MQEDEFTRPGIVRVTAAALDFAREFAESVGASYGGRYVTTFDWAESISVRDNKGAPSRQLGPCLLLGGYERPDVPTEFIQKAGKLEFAIKIPEAIWKASQERTIDVDNSKPFQLVLR